MIAFRRRSRHCCGHVSGPEHPSRGIAGADWQNSFRGRESYCKQPRRTRILREAQMLNLSDDEWKKIRAALGQLRRQPVIVATKAFALLEEIDKSIGLHVLESGGDPSRHMVLQPP